MYKTFNFNIYIYIIVIEFVALNSQHLAWCMKYWVNYTPKLLIILHCKSFGSSINLMNELFQTFVSELYDK